MKTNAFTIEMLREQAEHPNSEGWSEIEPAVARDIADDLEAVGQRLTHDQLVAIRRARSMVSGFMSRAPIIDKAEFKRILADLDAVLAAHGATP